MTPAATAGWQFVVATHSPILLAAPDARILQIEGDGAISHVGYDEAEPVTLHPRVPGQPAAVRHHRLAQD